MHEGARNVRLDEQLVRPIESKRVVWISEHHRLFRAWQGRDAGGAEADRRPQGVIVLELIHELDFDSLRTAWKSGAFG